MDFDFDVFISYTDSKDSTSEGSTNKWAQNFCQHLAVVMNRLCDRNLTFLLHDDLRSREKLIGNDIKDILPKTAVFVSIISPDCSESDDYINELNSICSLVYKDSDQNSRNINRIFKVTTGPLPENSKCACLDNELSYNFYEINRYNKKVVAFTNEEENPEDKYWSKLVDLAYDIYISLEAIKTGQKSEGEKQYIYLAETSFDQVENRDMLKRELQHLGYSIFPLVDLPLETDKLTHLINNYLKRSLFSVHIMGAFYGDFIKNSKHSITDIQNILASEFIKKNSDNTSLQRLIWIPSGLKITDQRQALYLKRLKRDEAFERSEVVEAPGEVFKSVLRKKLDEFASSEKQVDKAQKIYMIYDTSEKNKIEDVVKVLKQTNFQLIDSETQTSTTNPVTKHKQALVEANGILIYKGSSSKAWLNSKVSDVIKSPGYGRKEPYKALGIISNEKYDDIFNKFIGDVPVLSSDRISKDFLISFLSNFKN